jgi:nicotinamide-nucleotide amidase
MIRLPRDSHALLNPVGAALGCVARTGATSLVVLPGVPAEMRAMYERAFAPVHLKPSEPPAVAEIVTHGQEAALWDVLTDAERAFPRLRFGSYPQEDGHRIVLRVSGPADEVARAREFLTARVPGNQS